jgi:hypothetical protein
VEGTLDYVCGVTRGILWRGLGIEPPGMQLSFLA